ncbi:hypothetical protein H257_12693 [Aphanomyces astaci]|uniref:Core-binding (CB) domain-containing protein n=1 Tax=Aphanomyces astaci TaxID=112090 RepID=W4FXJ1_APHAT|nr:hypothetical protein H257_12693 [Aphanomyces astaci]ETV72220.1 hypothetical protein H257_12693 [Aphanomyces astaci]|eukprot:XP_009838288.1 hypothetical protein H257_12693 [Aphanomyces astaci]
MATVPQRETSTLEDIHGALVAERSKTAYASGIRQVVKWIQQTNQADALLSADGSINLAAFSYEDFVRFIVWTMQNTAVKASTMSGYRSAMRNYYKMQKTTSVKDSGKRPFFKSKTDQDGSKRRDPRHIYANPLQTHTCAFLALGLYLACNPMLAAGALFPGSSQRTRFGKGLKLALIEDNPVGSSEIGTHSIRKGAATFVSSGSTGGPLLVSICLRCG